jgi:hypothetical protein
MSFQQSRAVDSLELSLRLKLIVSRGLYGLFTAILVQFTSVHILYQHLLISLIGSSLAPFFIWTLVFILYIPTIAIAKMLKAKRSFDLYFRGLSVYFVSFILTHILTAS